MSSKITFSIHNQKDLKLKRPDFLSSAHQFTHPRYGTLSWKESDLSDKKYKLLDSNKNVLARFGKLKSVEQKASSSLWGSLSKKGKDWAFSIFVNADPEFLDWIIVSGLGVVEYRITSDRAWEEAIAEGVDASFG
jgi:predicted metal-dependent hydrolase